MKTELLHSDVQEFINQSLKIETAQLAFQKNPFPQIPWNEILTQIQSKRKAQEKLPTWFQTSGILYPLSLSIEQTSSEKCAAYKASLLSGDSLIDLTGGLGIDAFYFSKHFKTVTHCEWQPTLSELVQHNYQALKATNINCISGDGLQILQDLNQQWDCIYIDPARRNQAKEKVFFLKDCEPNVPELLDTYFEYSTKVFIKTAPLLDLAAGLNELKHVKEIHVVALDNEVKELLWLLEKGYTGSIQVVAVNIKNTETDVFKSTLDAESSAYSNYSTPKEFLYEPNSALMKTGQFNRIAEQYALDKLQLHSQLYTSASLIDFPGRVFKIVANYPFNKQTMKTYLQNQKVNITIRNFPISVSELRKKWKIKDGGNQYVFLTTDCNNEKIILICEKINLL
ncbi:class I SAM-dependent methyltransferase [Flavobacterium sp. NKUCC04_CG]|uniref:class I SAM-dependent methyltransferase n=1 Tax=Flavobacterium sp. NKUCC04_CG TaxID=2842121 RepID=UPI001C5B38BF|nr:class I SAM-dependent methyltransferase [Flavobacterium sp. NKUCC04_CG]MBW3517976.1 class I SAM-dependent methyltransferase [Flavobacterium sp. NKUCC04_CG]